MDPFTISMALSNLAQKKPFFKLIINPLLLKSKQFFNALLMLNKSTHNSALKLEW
jgi:hypothetical protein